ncbi:hypothetical protein Pst134EA_009457 [Puccinia striiformis f. sp. tritici]|uniref:uncharacterized protein n=1 Tax=Puccinia striiformis f. sp. tritici TaxID=168172 RepID=UPI002007FF72|nr:uncharacterized protein Pst134EA_031419 [Puccinia striiformis f. sp. tritici]XP_047808387.1 hypothetical protein Pst134EA_009457 [Puccinia striiformis f. sp. tritici]KAH9443357.1 hypothetical protein Pst134EA_031419 [Puccinia striiformis f. sp. tritici]KAH9468933.1 hypothetical protein Pst134EA_009457 [Puccinia striiformis f. sp. tritici]KAI9622953.1 hypothetical protein H4Q26_014894 [Puccinia striiformis f. sp. tritici PST-130]
MSLSATEHPGPESESVLADDVAAADERDEQSASEPCETDGEQSTNVEQSQPRESTATPVVETDSKPRLLSTHIDSATVAIPPVFQSLPAFFAPEFFATRSHPWNRSGFRYLACGPPVDQQHQDAEYPIYYTIETSPPGLVKWSWEDRSSYVYATKDGLSVTTDRGFRSARANLPIREGRWYFEIIMVRAGGEINHGARSEPEEAHVRVGIARRESGLNAPLGIDGYSYGIRDKTGEKVHLSRPQKYGGSFGSGDVIGILIDLPKMRKPNDGDCDDPARIERKRIPIRYRRQLYFESAEYPISKEMEDLADSALPAKLQPKQEPHKATPTTETPKKKSLPGQKQVDEEPPSIPTVSSGPPLRHLPVLKGSKVTFYKNGVSQGVAFRDLLDFLPLRVDSSPQNNEFWHHLSEDPNPDANNVKSVESLHDDGTLGYYPCVSVYGGGIARLNSGPEFKFAPPESNNYPLGEEADLPEKGISSDTDTRDDSRHTNKAWRPLSELYPIHIAEQRRLDELDIIEGQKQLAEATQKAELTPADVTNAKPRVFSKRKRVSSPSSTSLGTSTTKGKKKGKVGTAVEGLQPQIFKPSPLGNMEIIEEPEPTPPQSTVELK